MVKQLNPNINYEELANALSFSSTDHVFIASDLNKLALQAKNKGIAFNANKFIESFQSALPEGSIIVPSYTDNIKDGDTFDVKNSKPTTGALSNKILRRKDFKRSEDPIHSVLVWGKLQKEILNLKPKSTFGLDGLFHLLNTEKVKMLIIDVHLQNCFTYVHYVEEKLNVNYRKFYSLELKYINTNLEESNRKIDFHTKKLGIETNLHQLQEELISNKTISLYNYGDVEIKLLDFKTSENQVISFISSGKKLYNFNLKLYLKQLVKLILGHKKPLF